MTSIIIIILIIMIITIVTTTTTIILIIIPGPRTEKNEAETITGVSTSTCTSAPALSRRRKRKRKRRRRRKPHEASSRPLHQLRGSETAVTVGVTADGFTFPAQEEVGQGGKVSASCGLRDGRQGPALGTVEAEPLEGGQVVVLRRAVHRVRGASFRSVLVQPLHLMDGVRFRLGFRRYY